MELDYALVDVFAGRALEGNMLAIFTDARGLTTEQMQALARETNLAETTFILPGEPGEEVDEGVRVRIFTTQEELPFAGHPTLGTASWLYWHHPVLRGAQTIRLKLNIGPIAVTFESPAAEEAGVFATMRQGDAVFGAVHAREEVAPLLGLDVADLDQNLPVQTVSTGIPFVIVPVRNLEALGRLAVLQTKAQPWLDRVGAKFFYCVSRQGDGFRARMQFYNGEDPATGSAAGCAASYFVRHGLVASGRDTLIEQGGDIRRPSRITVRASLAGEAVHDVFVGGRTIPVASGRFFLPG